MVCFKDRTYFLKCLSIRRVSLVMYMLATGLQRAFSPQIFITFLLHEIVPCQKGLVNT